MLDPFTLPFVQRGLFELVLFAVAAGLVGTWIVLRGLAFYSHAVATASFPGLVLGQRWLAVGFDPGGARALGVRAAWPDVLLLGLVALAAVAALSALGSLLATGLLVVPAATARLWTRRVPSLQVWSVLIALVDGVVGLWVSVEVDVPPGAAI